MTYQVMIFLDFLRRCVMIDYIIAWLSFWGIFAVIKVQWFVNWSLVQTTDVCETVCLWHFTIGVQFPNQVFKALLCFWCLQSILLLLIKHLECAFFKNVVTYFATCNRWQWIFWSYRLYKTFRCHRLNLILDDVFLFKRKGWCWSNRVSFRWDIFTKIILVSFRWDILSQMLLLTTYHPYRNLTEHNRFWIGSFDHVHHFVIKCYVVDFGFAFHDNDSINFETIFHSLHNYTVTFQLSY